MSKNATETTTAKTFTLTEEGREVTYKRTEKGYCTRNGKRISAGAFTMAENDAEGAALAEIEASMDAVRQLAEGTDSFTLTEDGKAHTYERINGRCLRDGVRVSASEFEAALEALKAEVPEGVDPEGFAEWMEGQPADKWDEEDGVAELEVEVPETDGDADEVYAEEQVPPRPEFVIEGVRKDQATVGHKDGHEYVHDWFGKKYYRDGEEITKFEYEHEVYGTEAPEAGKKGGKAPKRARRPKDVAGTFETSEGTVTLTAKQLDFLRELSKLTEDDLLGNVLGGCWCDILCDVIGGQFRGKPMTVGAMISTICEKGLGTRVKEVRDTGAGRGRKVTAFRLTDKGVEVWEALTA